MICGSKRVSQKVDQLFEAMREAKRLYHYSLRRLIRRQKYAKMESMATKVAQNKTRDFWQKIKRMRQTKTVAPAID